MYCGEPATCPSSSDAAVACVAVVERFGQAEVDDLHAAPPPSRLRIRFAAMSR
jgi:hypothetical protein